MHGDIFKKQSKNEVMGEGELSSGLTGSSVERKRAELFFRLKGRKEPESSSAFTGTDEQFSNESMEGSSYLHL